MLLIDGHNLIGAAPGLSLTREQEGREALLRRIAAAKGAGGEPVVVVFDGNRPGAAKESRFGGIRVVYAPAHGSADEEILRRTRARNPREVTVVTSDRELAGGVRALGGRVLGSEEFLLRLARTRTNRRPTAVSEPAPEEAEVEEWLRLFAASERGDEHKI